MSRKLSLSAAAGLLILTIVGCRSPLEQLIRSQSPEVSPADYNSVQHSGAVVYAEGGQYFDNCPQDGGMHLGCPQQNGPLGWQCGRHCSHIFSHYTPPVGLSYPPANQPASVVFYPYYTLKGPDDFFYTGK